MLKLTTLKTLPFNELSRLGVASTALLAMTCVPTAQAEEKHVEDPTRIVTKLGAGFDGGMTFNGSIGLDDNRMLRARVDQSLENWSVGGSWLFHKGIVNFDVNGDTSRTSYNVGTYVPLSKLGVNTGKWMLFGSGGLSVTDNELAEDLSYGGYLGGFGIRPITEQLALLSFARATVATGDYAEGTFGAGASYKFTQRSSVNLMGFYSKDSYRSKNRINVSYSYQF